MILSNPDTSEVIRVVLQRLGGAVSAKFVTLTLFEQENPDNARTYFSPLDAPASFSMDRHDVAPEDRAILGNGLANRWIAMEADALLPAYLDKTRGAGMAHGYVEPILWRDNVCGALVFGYPGDMRISDEDRHQAHELADRVAVAVSSAWRDEQLYMQAHFDPLTGLPNRLLFKDRIDREIARSQRARTGFALLFIDLDHFKNVNDSFGHTTGDGVLSEAAGSIGN